MCEKATYLQNMSFRRALNEFFFLIWLKVQVPAVAMVHTIVLFLKLAPHSKIQFENITRFTWRITGKTHEIQART